MRGVYQVFELLEGETLRRNDSARRRSIPTRGTLSCASRSTRSRRSTPPAGSMAISTPTIFSQEPVPLEIARTSLSSASLPPAERSGAFRQHPYACAGAARRPRARCRGPISTRSAASIIMRRRAPIPIRAPRAQEVAIHRASAFAPRRWAKRRPALPVAWARLGDEPAGTRPGPPSVRAACRLLEIAACTPRSSSESL